MTYALPVWYIIYCCRSKKKYVKEICVWLLKQLKIVDTLEQVENSFKFNWERHMSAVAKVMVHYLTSPKVKYISEEPYKCHWCTVKYELSEKFHRLKI